MDTTALADLGAWGHRYQNILKTGRCSHIPPTGMPDEAVEEYMTKIVEEDKAEERYRALNDVDNGYVPVKGLEFAWTTKVHGD